MPLGILDTTLYRDDVLTDRGARPPLRRTEMPSAVDDRVVVLVDDVVNTGRTIRAAMDALMDFGRPKAVRVVALVDRGHRELPIKIDYVGKNIPTQPRDKVGGAAGRPRPETRGSGGAAGGDAVVAAAGATAEGGRAMIGKRSARHRGPRAARHRAILETAQRCMTEIGERDVKKVPTLRGRTVINLFFEPSTRTQTSFEIAGKRLSADVVNFSPSSSSKKGRELLDTAQDPRRDGPGRVVIRHKVAGVPKRIADVLEAPVINAGDGAHEHPTQALLDMLTVLEEKGRDRRPDGGDHRGHRPQPGRALEHLRLPQDGRRGPRAGPPTMIPPTSRCSASRPTPAARGARRRRRRDGAAHPERAPRRGATFPSMREYAATFGLDRAKLRYAKDDAIVMHPGPVNRGVELAHDLADHRPSVILDQVRNGVALRMAVLYLLAGRARPRSDAAASRIAWRSC